MRKTFQLHVEGKHPDRLVEAVKHDIRKYIKRERRRVLPEGSDYWDFDCKFGNSAEAAEPLHLSAITAAIDAVVQAAGPQFYVEILARPAQRPPRSASVEPAEAAPSTPTGVDAAAT